MLKGKKILLGVTGGIAAYKAAQLCRELKKHRADVTAVMTDAGKQFITPTTMQALSGNPVFSAMFNLDNESRINHIALAREADVVVVAPATADFIAKAANGFASDLLSTLVLATTSPIVFAPGMNRSMWENPITQKNVETLKTMRGVIFVGPDSGELACGEEGAGRMSDPEKIADAVFYASRREKDLAGETVLVTAGATIEDIDPVRFITNRSSGKMGFAIAREAKARGAQVTVVAGSATAPVPSNIEVIRVRSAAQMKAAVMERAANSHIVIMAAAVSDYKCSQVSQQKIKKSTNEPFCLTLEPTDDILWGLGKSKPASQFLVGFAAETSQVMQNATEKLRRKNLDLIVANDVTEAGAGFEVDTNVVRMIDRSGHVETLPLLTKIESAGRILDYVQALRAQKSRGNRGASSQRTQGQPETRAEGRPYKKRPYGRNRPR